MVGFTKTDLKISSATPGWDLDAWEYLPSDSLRYPEPRPVIIMAHGWSATKKMGLASYAEAFSSVGYACLVFDYRRWGASDGTPRHILSIPEQHEDYRTMIKFARRRDELDPQKIILWGYSFAGGHIITLSAESELNIAATIALCPFVGGLQPIPMNLGFLKTVVYSLADKLKQLVGLSPLYMPAASRPGELGGLATAGALEGLSSLAEEPSEWPNEIAASIMMAVPNYMPRATADKINTPILLVICEQDNLCLAEFLRDVVEKAPHGEALVLDPAGHFDVFAGKPCFEEALQKQKEYLQRIVPV